MATVEDILLLLNITILGLLIVSSTIYLLPLLCLSRFHTISNAFTGNVAFAIWFSASSWFIIMILTNYKTEIFNTSASCLIINFFQTFSTIHIPLALISVSLNRVCSIIYPAKAYFRSKHWTVVSIGSQWILGFLLSLPHLFSTDYVRQKKTTHVKIENYILAFLKVCITAYWVNIYTFLVMVIIPLTLNTILNAIILRHVRQSTQRIQPTHPTISHASLQRRDIRLLQHMIILFCLFIVGWCPIYISAFIDALQYNPLVNLLFMTLAELSIFFDILDLFLYNHDLRRFFLYEVFRVNQPIN